jgi:hypothetical protein
MLNVAAVMFWLRYLNDVKGRKSDGCAVKGERHPHGGRRVEEECDGHIEFRYIL